MTTDNGAPPWPAGSYIRVSNLSDTGMTLNWINATDDIGVTGYNIYKDGSVTGSVYGSTISYQVTGLAAGQTYTLKVEARDYAGNVSTSGPAITIKTTDSSHPVAPPALTLVTNPINQGRAAVFTFAPDAAWQAALGGITVDGAVYGSDKYSISPGVFKICAGVLPSGDTLNLTITRASGATLTGLAVTTQPFKLNYFVGEALNIKGLVVSGIFSDGTTQVEPVTAANVTGFNSSAPVNGQVLTVTYEGQTTTFTVNILPAPAVPLTGAFSALQRQALITLLLLGRKVAD